MLGIEKCCLVVIDVQGKLAELMYQKESLFRNIQILIKAAKILSIPVIWLQQVPKALGDTVPEIAELLKGYEPVNKNSFSCCGDKIFTDKLAGLQRQQVLMCGIEAHVCVYQTSVDLKKVGKEVVVVADAVSSRTLDNKNIALNKLGGMGVDISSVEMVLFELLKTSEHPCFREVAKLIK